MAAESPTLSEGKEENTDVVPKPVEVKEDKKPVTAVSERRLWRKLRKHHLLLKKKLKILLLLLKKALKLPLLMKAAVKMPLPRLKKPMKLQKRPQEKKLQKRSGRLSLRQHQLITASQLQIKQGTASPDTLNIIAA